MAVYLNRTELAEAFDVSKPTIDNWVRAGMPIVERGGSGKQSKFNLPDCITWRENRRIAEEAGNKPKDLDEIEKRTATAKMEMAELELAKLRGLVAPIEDFERAVASLCTNIRENVMNVRARACTLLLGCTDETEFKEALGRELKQALAATENAKLTLGDEIADDDAE